MKKKKRHDLVKKMITEKKLGTQKDIQTRLEEEGIYVTQTTLSRDLREIPPMKRREFPTAVAASQQPCITPCR